MDPTAADCIIYLYIIYTYILTDTASSSPSERPPSRSDLVGCVEPFNRES